MGPLVVVVPEVGPQFPPGFTGAGVGFQVHHFVLHRGPQPLREDVVAVAAFTIHADLHPVLLQRLDGPPTGELAALAGVEHLRPDLTQRLLQGVDAEVGPQGVGQSLGHQVEESPGHGQVGDVGGPHLVGPGDLGIPQQIWALGKPDVPATD